jgi:hypothetical protein
MGCEEVLDYYRGLGNRALSKSAEGDSVNALGAA